MPVLNDAAAVYVGGTPAVAVYLGGEKMWPSAPPPPVATFVHWDASDDTTFTFSSGTSVAEWRDKGPGGHHLIQADPAKQPTRADSQSGVLFDGVDDMLDALQFAIPQPFTIVLVVDTTDVADAFFSWFTSQDMVRAGYGVHAGKQNGWNVMSAGISTGGSWDALGLHVWTMQFSQPCKMYRDDTNDGYATDPGDGALDGRFWVGMDWDWASVCTAMTVYELQILNRVLSDTERTDLVAALRAKWGTP